MSRPTPFRAYELYIAINVYFDINSTYDFIKFKGKMGLKLSSFEKRKDKFQFVRVSNKYNSEDEIVAFYLSNILSGKRKWIGQYEDKEFLLWVAKREKMLYELDKEFRQLLTIAKQKKLKFPELFEWSGYLPEILISYSNDEKISLDLLAVLDDIFKFSVDFNKLNKNNDIWKEISNKLTKYKKFVSYDIPKHNMNFKKILKFEFPELVPTTK